MARAMPLSANLPDIPDDKPVLIAGPTASGKSALALQVAKTGGGVIINADALQVFDGWRILTARPPDADLAAAQHHLYGHIAYDADYSTGQWLRDIKPLLGKARPIIVGGTGLYFTALTQGLAEIPLTPDHVRQTANAMSLDAMLTDIDSHTTSRIDTRNRARVQRAWEVQAATGRTIADWQAETPPPLLPIANTTPIVLVPQPDWLNTRIAARFDQMIAAGALDEARAMDRTWHPKHASSKAIGAAELIAHIRGEMSLDAAKEAAIIATRQYGKRQRTWFRARMDGWHAQPLG